MSVWCGSVLAGAENTNSKRLTAPGISGFGFSTALCREYQCYTRPALRGRPGGRLTAVFSAPGSFRLPVKQQRESRYSFALKRQNSKEIEVFSDCGFGVPENVGFMCALPKVVA